MFLKYGKCFLSACYPLIISNITDRRTDQRTDQASSTVACPRLKIRLYKKKPAYSCYWWKRIKKQLSPIYPTSITELTTDELLFDVYFSHYSHIFAMGHGFLTPRWKIMLNEFAIFPLCSVCAGCAYCARTGTCKWDCLPPIKGTCTILTQCQWNYYCFYSPRQDLIEAFFISLVSWLNLF